jgi:GT2 family glycosyltransferase
MNLHTPMLTSPARRLPWPNTQSLLAAVGLALRVDASATLRALRELLPGRRVRAWNLLCGLASRHADYYQWWTRFAEEQHLRAWRALDARPPIAACLIYGHGADVVAFARTVDSLKSALGPDVVALPVTQGEDSQGVLAAQRARLTKLPRVAWLLACRAGDELAPDLGSVLAKAIPAAGSSRVIYWDEDALNDGMRTRPFIKPGWDRRFHLTRDVLGGACAIDLKMVLDNELPPSPEDFSVLALKCAGASDGAFHVPLILVHRHRGRSFVDIATWHRIIKAALPHDLAVVGLDSAAGHLVLAPPEPARWPSVSIIIPTRDKPALIGPCLASLTRLTYPGAVEILVVDNGTTDAHALSILHAEQRSGHIKLLHNQDAFNFSRLNNMAAARARGELLCLLNNDVEALDGDWLAMMVRHALGRDVGAVGAMLLYGDGTIQHAGVAVGTGGAAGHVQRGIDPACITNYNWHGVTRQVSAVTGACLVVRADAYRSVGGLDESCFPVAFNDVDFCLRLQARGLANIYCAQARLLHHESQSRGNDMDKDKIDRFRGELGHLQERWHTLTHDDPHHNSLFMRSAEQCVLAP